MAGSLTDISIERERRVELETAHRRLALALDATRTGLWDWNLLSDEMYFNDSFYTMLGYELGELPMNTNTWRMLCHPDDLEKATAGIQACCKAETAIYRCEQRLKQKNGDWLWIDGVGKVVEWNTDGQPIRMIGVHIDIHSLKRTEEALRQAKDEALELTRAKGEFLANMSHEIRTPMNAVLGMNELLLETSLDEEQSELASTAYNSARALLSIINDILDFSKMQAGKIDLIPEQFSLRGLVEGIEKLHNVILEQKRIVFVTNIEKSVPDNLYADHNRLRQILVNLIGNALKFTSENGAILLRVERVRQLENSLKLQFAVSDTGIGIPAHQQVKIFESFEQADSGITREYGGTGLGLSIAASLVELMNGKIELASEPGLGSVFSFTIEVGIGEVEEVQTGYAEVTADLPALPALRVLLAEDNIINQQLAIRILERAGHSVDLARNGKEAIALFEKKEFDLILMDMQMPEMGGQEASDIIRTSERGKIVPIVAVTANAMAGDAEKYLSAGMDGYVSKPIDRRVLFEVIARSIQKDIAKQEASQIA